MILAPALRGGALQEPVALASGQDAFLKVGLNA
jgi:hypothetical protein